MHHNGWWCIELLCVCLLWHVFISPVRKCHFVTCLVSRHPFYTHTVRFNICMRHTNTWRFKSGDIWFHTACKLHSLGWKWWVWPSILPWPPHFFTSLTTSHCAGALIVSYWCSRWINIGDRLKPGAALGMGQNGTIWCPGNEKGVIVIEAMPIKAMHTFTSFLIVAAGCIYSCTSVWGCKIK